MDRVFIEGLEVITTIGVYDWEKEIQQKLVLDLELAHDNRPAASTDDIKLALDYASLSSRVTEYVQTHHFELVETVAENVAALIRDEFGVPWLRLKLHKPGAVVNARSVGVQIERGSLEGQA